MTAEDRAVRMAPGFEERLSGFELDSLERDVHSVFALSPELRLIYFNPAWLAFARANGGDPAIKQRFGLGTPIAQAISAPLRDFYLLQYQRILASGERWDHEYECSTPERYRRYHQLIYPFHNRTGLLVVNSLVEERDHDPDARPSSEPDLNCYQTGDGLITQCSHCRRVQRVREPGCWDWVPEWVRHMPPNTSHSLCIPCYEYYWIHRAGS